MIPLSDRYSVSPQISAEDIPSIKSAGFSTIICNRPDFEVPPDLQADTIRAAAEAAGLRFEVLPVTHQGMTPQTIARQMELTEASDGPVLAYCNSGTRSSVVWALGQVGKMSVDDILTATRNAGYNLDGLKPTLMALSQRG
ncbi:TIGR01244 family sulfur transferase [Mesobacterium sp. TK19101]|uniref:TIGR01244 family sulfur transferase n=1 Tax=Mesobacterium hydrothermale TaxID=3111907 RepID=A0ABU6HD53_9RHOB|nr:TIGR01244 family sulfur transferase [Mesobacterium sp. TK19101]MEC3860384.1 TIGR01244 family sulfur transferase [Mesobacterium sp. TK19101]